MTKPAAQGTDVEAPLGGPVSRRTSLSRAGRLAIRAGALASGGLVSCERAESPPTFDWDGQAIQGVLNFANWPYYIDRNRSNRHPSLEFFTQQTGVEVDYSRPIRGNEQFFEKIRPALRAGRPTGYDLVVVTNGPQLSKLIRSGWLLPLDRGMLENFERHASPVAKDPPWDPGNRYSVAWQSGVTGIGYRPEAVEALGREPNSVADLWSEAVKGKVSMMSDLLDLGSVGLLASGVEPELSTPDDWTGAAEMLGQQRDAGIVRGYFDQGYLRALKTGEVWLGQAWSGDIFQAQREGHELEFVVPEEGGLFWTDNMVIPAHAEHPLDALTFMDFVYQPRVAEMITADVGYITPVPGIRSRLRSQPRSSAMAKSPLVFPEATSIGGSSAFKTYPSFETGQEATDWRNIFGVILSL
jgi:spermidine/putrescine transport system substrate-binding protein